MATAGGTRSEFVIWGPSVTAGVLALHAVHALYYLPSNFILVMPAVRPGERAAFEQIDSLIQRDGLAGRVTFTDKPVAARKQAIVAASAVDDFPGHIFGHSPEELASAALRVARAKA